MTDCLIFNITLPGRHPSSICVELSNLLDSLRSTISLFGNPLQEESLMEFIEQFSRTEEVMPTDRTVGFVVINAEKKKMAVSISIPQEQKDLQNSIISEAENLRKNGVDVELDLS